MNLIVEGDVGSESNLNIEDYLMRKVHREFKN
jgi:hypothetical protein